MNAEAQIFKESNLDILLFPGGLGNGGYAPMIASRKQYPLVSLTNHPSERAAQMRLLCQYKDSSRGNLCLFVSWADTDTMPPCCAACELSRPKLRVGLI